MKKVLLSLLIMLSLCAKANHWTPDEYQYSNNMTLIGVIAFDDVEQRSDSLEIGAFCAEECRGSAIAQYDANFDRYYVCIMIYGNDGDSISIRCYNHGIGVEMDTASQTGFIFNTNDMIGNAVEPVIFSFDLSDTPEDPGDNPEDPGDNPEDPGNNPEDPGDNPEDPGDNPEDPGDNPEDPGDNPEDPGDNPEDPGDNPDHPVDPELPEDTVYYQVIAEAYPSAGGSIDGVGEYLESDTCTLQITTNLNYVYEGLYEKDTLVTIDTIYSFVVNSDRYFVAKFTLTESIDEQTASFRLYPNPVNDKLYIETEMEIEEVVVYDVYGRQQTTDNGQQSSFIDVSGLNAGVYFVMIKTDRGVVTKHFVKE